MNHHETDPVPVPPPTPPQAPAPATPPLHITTGAVLEALLKDPGRVLLALEEPRRGGILGRLVLVIALCAAIYGLVMGSLSGGAQLWAAPLKVTIGLFASILLCLPSLYIFLCLNGADLRPAQVTGALLGMAALITLLLIGFAPVSWIFSQSTDSVVLMGVLHLLFWIIGLWFGVRLIHGLADCGGASSSDRSHLKVWIIIFTLVSLQMTAALRPLIGTSDTLLPTEKKFFVQHWMDCMNR